ncbi:Mu transposase C-terminal domain-containing protein [Xanthomonadaceae bacterium XH05]|nr:Mu transposase C-terminal domain-containing protein [Xanthomonadaceae bacterium XH05]
MADGSLPGIERWYSAAELAGLPGLPGTERGVRKMAEREQWPAQRRDKGKGVAYAATSLPPQTQAALALRESRAACVAEHRPAAPPAALSRESIESAWARYERAPDKLKDVAKRRLRALQAVDTLHASGLPLMQARSEVAAQMQREGVRGGSVQSLCRWSADVAGVDRAYWLALLLPAYTGRTATADIDPAAWDIFKADYLRLEAPSAASCYRRLERIAAKHDEWPTLPALRTFVRRIEREISPQVLTLARKGEEALMRSYPAQERDRSLFTALEGVNADGHMWDVGVTFPDGTTGRAVIVGWQDLYSGKILAWRIGQTESSDLVRLAFCDLVRGYGIPGNVWLDNGRAFASKYLTGRTPNRYRFKVKEEDPAGIITALGVQVHWVTPYHGQAKPIERAWRDFCANISKHPAFAGAYLGNNVTNKPANYGSRTVPFDEFVRVVESEIHAHNARIGRRTKVCDGRSFDAAFGESYAANPIRKATAEQLRTLLLAAEAVTANRTDGSVHLAGNRYWCEALARHKGQKLVLRFDPMQLHGGVHVYQLDGEYVGEAQCMVSIGFADTNASREHARAKSQWRRAAKQQLEAERRMEAATVAAQLPDMAAPELPATSVIEGMFTTRPAATPREERLAATGTDEVTRAVKLDDYLKRIQEARQNDRV